MPAAQDLSRPLSSGDGSSSHKAAASFRDCSAYSSFRCCRQNSSVIPVTASYLCLILRGMLWSASAPIFDPFPSLHFLLVAWLVWSRGRLLTSTRKIPFVSRSTPTVCPTPDRVARSRIASACLSTSTVPTMSSEPPVFVVRYSPSRRATVIARPALKR